MAYANNMSNLVQKIENRLGLKPLKLPDEISKDTWASDVIMVDTIVTYSRYFPNKWRIPIDAKNHPQKDGWFLIDEDMLGTGTKILGIKDLDFTDLSEDSLSLQINAGLGVYDFMGSYLQYAPEDIMLAQARADNLSLFNRGIYVEYRAPNFFRLQNCTSADMSRSLRHFYVEVLIEHTPDLRTLTPTQMETFEALAQADVAHYLYAYLLHYDGLETVYTNIDLKLQVLENEAGKRDEIINRINEGYVSAANQHQPIMLVQ